MHILEGSVGYLFWQKVMSRLNEVTYLRCASSFITSAWWGDGVSTGAHPWQRGLLPLQQGRGRHARAIFLEEIFSRPVRACTPTLVTPMGQGELPMARRTYSSWACARDT